VSHEQGILLVAFGEEYNKIGAACCKKTRQVTDLPIHVLYNKSEPSLHGSGNVWLKYWDNIPNVTGTLIDLPTSENRQIKTRMIEYTPFDYTLYLDCDCFLQPNAKVGLDYVFDFIETGHLVLNRYYLWNFGDKVLNLYAKAMRQFMCKLPFQVFNGAVMGFRKEREAEAFFATWNAFWIAFGKEREMPPLACALQTLNPLIQWWQHGEEGFMSVDGPRLDCLIQHHYGKDFFERYNLPRFNHKAPKTMKGDFSWVEFK
jgi:hypothetical protein